MFARKETKIAIPLQLVTINHPFQQWRLNIISETTPNSSQQFSFILTTSDYFSHWTKAIPLQKVNEIEIISFLENNIISSVGVHDSVVFDNSYYFSSLKLIEYALEKGIKFQYSRNYYPWGNVVAESSNKGLIIILQKLVIENKKNGHNSLFNALFIY